MLPDPLVIIIEGFFFICLFISWRGEKAKESKDMFDYPVSDINATSMGVAKVLPDCLFKAMTVCYLTHEWDNIFYLFYFENVEDILVEHYYAGSHCFQNSC